MSSLVQPAWNLPHGLGGLSTPSLTAGSSASSVQGEVEAATTETETSHIKYAKPHDYTTQCFPDHPGPTGEKAQLVYERLCEAHGTPPPQPAILPPPSDKVAGCGNVSDILEAVQRTSISGNVTMERANGMLQALVQNFPTPEGCKWVVDWETIRCDVTKEQLSKVLASGRGGMQDVKAKLIVRALKTIFEDNIRRSNALLEELSTGTPTPISRNFKENIPGFPALSNLTEDEKNEVINDINDEPLSLNWLHLLKNDYDILNVLITINGVQTKTASCVTLFSLQRPSFAVDTHVHRFCNWLGWVPAGTNPEKTFYHCDPKIPDHLKHDLHQLFIRHGQLCFKCTGKSKPGSAQWDNTICVLEDLLDRSTPHNHSSKKGFKKLKSKVIKDEIEVEVEEQAPAIKRAKVSRKKTTTILKAVKDEEDSEEAMEDSSGEGEGLGGKRPREDDDDEYEEKPAKKQKAASKKPAVRKVAGKKVLSQEGSSSSKHHH